MGLCSLNCFRLKRINTEMKQKYVGLHKTLCYGSLVLGQFAISISLLRNKAGFYDKEDRPMHCAPSIHVLYCPLALVRRPTLY